MKRNQRVLIYCHIIMEIKTWKQLTHVLLKDGRILVSESSPKEINDRINKNSHILIEWELHSKFDIISALPAKIDDVEWFILNQPKDIQMKIRQKKDWLKKEMNKEMTYAYAVNYVTNL